MKISYIECDTCKARENIEPPTFGGFPHNWIEVKKPMGRSEERISAGISHFCSEACLTRKLSCDRAMPNVAVRLCKNLPNTMKAKMKDNLIARYEMSEGTRGELLAVAKMWGWDECFATKAFLKSIEGKMVELVFTGPDAFEKNDNNVWLPNDLWDAA